MSDSDFLADFLSDGEWHSHGSILERSFQDRGYGLTVHSRAADLRNRGHVVETRLERDRRGRTLSFYRLVTLDEPEPCGTASGSSSVPAPPSPVPVVPSPEPDGTLPLFVCNIDESAGQRGAYRDAA